MYWNSTWVVSYFWIYSVGICAPCGLDGQPGDDARSSPESPGARFPAQYICGVVMLCAQMNKWKLWTLSCYFSLYFVLLIPLLTHDPCSLMTKVVLYTGSYYLFNCTLFVIWFYIWAFLFINMFMLFLKYLILHFHQERVLLVCKWGWSGGPFHPASLRTGITNNSTIPESVSYILSLNLLNFMSLWIYVIKCAYTNMQ